MKESAARGWFGDDGKGEDIDDIVVNVMLLTEKKLSTWGKQECGV